MDHDQAVILVAKRTGKHHVTDRTDITTALAAAMEEIGTHIEIRKAQSVIPRSIAVSANSVTFPKEFQRILSVAYQYTSGGNTIKDDLRKAEPSEFDRMNEGIQNQETDSFTHFMTSGPDIYIGPGITKTGGWIIIRGQRPLTTYNIGDLPNTMLAVHGAVANLLPGMNPDNSINAAGAAARRLFEKGLIPAGLAAIPVKQQFDTVRLSDEMISDDIYRSSL